MKNDILIYGLIGAAGLWLLTRRQATQGATTPASVTGLLPEETNYAPDVARVIITQRASDAAWAATQNDTIQNLIQKAVSYIGVDPYKGTIAAGALANLQSGNPAWNDPNLQMLMSW